jgi:hypothetical protein
LSRPPGREDAAGVAPLQRGLQADEAGQEPGGGGLRRDAAAGEDEAELRVGAGQADVHGQLHGDADADRGAVHGGDQGLQAVVHAQRHAAAAVAVDVADLAGLALQRLGVGAVEGGPAAGQVRAGAEGAAGAGDDHGADVVVASVTSKTRISSSIIFAVKAFIFSGRFRVMVATPLSVL